MAGIRHVHILINSNLKFVSDKNIYYIYMYMYWDLNTKSVHVEVIKNY
jgi:hypothetical protein